MALPLETQLLAQLKLREHWSQHSEASSNAIRLNAAKNLANVIAAQHRKDPKSIAAPNEDVIRLAVRIAHNEKPNRIANTWVAFSSIIGIHITAAHNPNEAPNYFAQLQRHLIENYKELGALRLRAMRTRALAKREEARKGAKPAIGKTSKPRQRTRKPRP